MLQHETRVSLRRELIRMQNLTFQYNGIKWGWLKGLRLKAGGKTI